MSQSRGVLVSSLGARVSRLSPSWLAGALLALAAPIGAGCSSGDEATRSFDFGPYAIEPQQEITRHCVQMTLGNEAPLFINSVELTTGAGFHHSNWLFGPEDVFPGPDGTFDCNERGYSEAIAAVFGGVLFAQSTQSPHEIQAFAPDVAQLHLLNASDKALHVTPNLKVTAIPEEQVNVRLAGISFQNQALALPAGRRSRFTVECDLATPHQRLLDRPLDFRVYYALAHYHELGMGMAIDAVRADGSSMSIYSTANAVGDSLGGPIDPAFDMSGFAKLRMSCDFYNPRSQAVGWGIGDQEMCVFLAFSDSTYLWSGGVNTRQAPQNETQVGNMLQYTNPCMVVPLPAER
jgi:hypothetical protein